MINDRSQYAAAANRHSNHDDNTHDDRAHHRKEIENSKDLIQLMNSVQLDEQKRDGQQKQPPQPLLQDYWQLNKSNSSYNTNQEKSNNVAGSNYKKANANNFFNSDIYNQNGSQIESNYFGASELQSQYSFLNTPGTHMHGNSEEPALSRFEQRRRMLGMNAGGGTDSDSNYTAIRKPSLAILDEQADEDAQSSRQNDPSQSGSVYKK